METASPNAKPSLRPDPSTQTDPALERRTEYLLDALKIAIAQPGEHRLFQSGKLSGLFPTRGGISAEAALFALKEGLLDTVRTEAKGKMIVEWVAATARGVAFVNDHDSPKSILKELKQVLDASRDGVPAWLIEAKRDLATLADRFEERATQMLTRLNELAVRAEAALRRAEASGAGLGAPVGGVVSWGVEALAYLDRRKIAGCQGDCPLPELFRALVVQYPDLTLQSFHEGLRRLYDVRALRLMPPTGDIPEPEYAILAGGQLMFLAGR